MFPSPAHAEAPDGARPVKVFILAGQSNMQGYGFISAGKDGDLEYAANNGFGYLKDDAGKWAERKDVYYYHKSKEEDDEGGDEGADADGDRHRDEEQR